MNTNMVSADRVIRAVVAVTIAVLFFFGILPGPLGMWLLIVAVIFSVTAFTGFCPIYKLLGIGNKAKAS